MKLEFTIHYLPLEAGFIFLEANHRKGSLVSLLGCSRLQLVSLALSVACF